MWHESIPKNIQHEIGEAVLNQLDKLPDKLQVEWNRLLQSFIGDEIVEDVENEADRLFIAHSRQDIEDLIHMVESLLHEKAL